MKPERLIAVNEDFIDPARSNVAALGFNGSMPRRVNGSMPRAYPVPFVLY